MENSTTTEKSEELKSAIEDVSIVSKSGEKMPPPNLKHHCGICNITYQTLKGIHLHNLKMHDPEAVWCHICHRPFKKKENFEKHNLQFHSAPEELKKTIKTRKPSKWAPRPVILPPNLNHPAPEPGVEQIAKRTRVEDEFSSAPETFNRMDPSSLTAYAWDLIKRTPPFASGSKTKMPPSSFLISTPIQPTISYNPVLMSSFQAAPRGRDPWADQGMSSSRAPLVEEGCSRSSDLFSKNVFHIQPEPEPSHPPQSEPTSAFEALTDKFKIKTQLQQQQQQQQLQPSNHVNINSYFEPPREQHVSHPSQMHNRGPSMHCYPSDHGNHQELMQPSYSTSCSSSSDDLDLNVFFSDFITNPTPEPNMWNTLSTMYSHHGENHYSTL